MLKLFALLVLLLPPSEECYNHRDCATDEACVNNFCTKTCRTHLDCITWEVCWPVDGVRVCVYDDL